MSFTRKNSKINIRFTCRKIDDELYSFNFKHNTHQKYGFLSNFLFSLKMKNPYIEKIYKGFAIRDRSDSKKTILFYNDGKKRTIKFNLEDYNSVYELSSKFADKLEDCLGKVNNEKIEFECGMETENKIRSRTKTRIRKNNILKTLLFY